ncbi:uncharacterized protein ARMOST_07028 [Armillaria ostoyae]|uniref:Uncharacterized protein n=1 Tax=Armillaria ostoyae TaxID=47428 RepID=A0A284R4N9_ARMOS|nr:uncharacterized protein ARMOST_07028 [Armillaria ostoyae]
MSAPPRSPLSVVFLLHIAVEIPLAIQGIWSPATLPFLQLTNTTLVLLKVSVSDRLLFLPQTIVVVCILGSGVMYSRATVLPVAGYVYLFALLDTTVHIAHAEFLPGKRALAMGLCVYHSSASTVLYYAPRFIPYSFGPFFEQYRITPENAWGTVHGLVGLGMVVWWQLTLPYVQMGQTR